MLKRLTQLIYFLLFSNLILADYTATLNFVDSTGTAIDRYLGYWDDIYIEIYDEDLSGEVDVFLSSDTDAEGETVTLSEVEDFRFRGSIPVELLEYEAIVTDEDELQREIQERVKQITPEHPDWDEKKILDEATSKVRAEHMKRTAEDYISYPATRDDGLIQLKAGDMLYASYADATNDYGEEEELSVEVLYGVWAGPVVQIDTDWTIDDSPVIVTGDLAFYDCDLTIGDGVEVLFRGDYQFYMIGGKLDINGSEGNEIIFRPEDIENAEPGAWAGIRIDRGYIPGTNNYQSDSRLYMEYADISYADIGIYMYSFQSEDVYISNSSIRYSLNHGIENRYPDRNLFMSNVSSEYNGGHGFYQYYPWERDVSVENSSFSYNENSGMYLDRTHNGSVSIINSSFDGNNGHGVDIYTRSLYYSASHIIDSSSFTNNTNYGLRIHDVNMEGYYNNRYSYQAAVTNSEFSGNGQSGMQFHNIGSTSQWMNGSWQIDFSGNTVSDNVESGLWVEYLRQNQNIGQASFMVTENQIYDNGGSEFKIGYMTSVGENSSIVALIENNDFDDDQGYVVEMDSNLEEDRLGEELTMRNNYWGELATAEMNEGNNPKDITQLYDYYDDDNRHLINYSSWAQNSFFEQDNDNSYMLLVPNGGEEWFLGDTYTISWTGNDDEIDTGIRLYKGDESLGDIVGDVDGANSYSWTIPLNLEPGDDYKIEVYDSGGLNPEPFDFSDGYFSILDSDPNTHLVPEEYDTIQLAIDAASDGDEVIVSPGSYAEGLTINKSIHLRCPDQGQCVIDANNIARAISITGNDVLVDGFDIVGNDQTQIGIVIRPDTENIELENNIIHGMALPMTEIDPFSYGILVFGNSFDDMPTNLTFRGNEVYNVSGGGIVLGQYVDTVMVEENYIHDLNPVDFLGFPVSYGVGAELTSELTITGNTFENLYIGSNIFTSQTYVGDNNYQGVEFLMLSSLSEYEFDESLFWYQIQYSINYEGTDYIGDVYTDSFDIAAEYADEGSVIIDSDGNAYQQNCFEDWVDDDATGLVGDVNQDGGLNVLDILEVIAYIFGEIEFNECQLNQADLTEDSMVNIYDIILLVNCIMDDCNNISVIEQINQRK